MKLTLSIVTIFLSMCLNSNSNSNVNVNTISSYWIPQKIVWHKFPRELGTNTRYGEVTVLHFSNRNVFKILRFIPYTGIKNNDSLFRGEPGFSSYIGKWDYISDSTIEVRYRNIYSTIHEISETYPVEYHQDTLYCKKVNTEIQKLYLNKLEFLPTNRLCTENRELINSIHE